MAAAPNKSLGLVTLTRVRLSYPFLYEPDEGGTDDEGNATKPKYRAAFLLPKPKGKFAKDAITTVRNLDILKKAKEEVMRAKWGDDLPNLPPNKIALQDGKYSDDEYTKECYFINANETEKPLLLTRRKDEDGLWIPSTTDGEIYAGCWVNVILQLWAQDHKKYGKRINAMLKSVQFHERGDAFGSKTKVKRQDAFTDVDEEELDSFGSEDFGDDDDADDLI